jgi:transposase InsO family protein
VRDHRPVRPPTDPGHVILYTSDGEVRQEFFIVVTTRAAGGQPAPSSEDSEVRWVPLDELDDFQMDRSMRLKAPLRRRCLRCPAPPTSCGQPISPSTRPGKARCTSCVVLDAWSRRVVGWAIDSSQRADLATNALGMTIDSHGPATGAIIHGDHGTQGGFNRSSQHRLAELRVAVRSVLRRVSSSRVSCAAGR